MWQECVTGLEAAKGRLSDLATKSENEFHAIHTPTKEIVARVNIGGVAGK